MKQCLPRWWRGQDVGLQDVTPFKPIRGIDPWLQLFEPMSLPFRVQLGRETKKGKRYTYDRHLLLWRMDETAA